MVKKCDDYTYNLADDREDYDVEEDVQFNVEDEYVNFVEDEQIDEPNDNQGNDGNDGDQANEANDEIRDREIIMDYTNLFSTMEHFASRDALIKWVRQVGKENNIVVVVTCSDAGLRRKKAYVMLACERGGVYRQFKGKVKDTVERNEKKKAKKEENVDFNVEEEESTKGRITGSKKCGCPFMLKGKQICPSEWSLEVKCGTHNHPIATHLEGHSFEGRLNDEEEELVIDLSKCNAPPKDVLLKLKRKHEHNHSTIRTIYNARKKHRVIQACGRTQLQYLMSQLVEKKYFQYTRRCEKTSVIKELFFAHPVSIQLVHAFPKVLLIDCTYKTNRYKLPLLEIVGVTSTGMTFSIASVFLVAEKEENYAWALGVLRSLLGKNSLPTVIVTDREIALMNALASIFPETRHFLCTWHIDKNVLAKCKKKFTNDNQWNEFNAQFNNLWKSDSEQEFEDALRKLHLNFASNEKKPVDYVMKEWINPYKEKFVRAWTNEFMHYGNTTSNRVESHHSALKKMLGNSMGNFQTCFTKCDTLFEACHIAIKASFEKSVNVAQHKFSSNIYSRLRGMVSQVALDKLFDEAKEVRQPFFDVKNCKHILRKVYGLPCAHEIEEYVYADKPIPVNALDSFWRKLDFQPIKQDVNTDLDSRFEEVVNDMGEVYKNFSQEEKMIFLRKIRELANPATTNLVEPLPKVDTRGRPAKGKGKAKTTKASDYSTKRDPSLFESRYGMYGSTISPHTMHPTK